MAGELTDPKKAEPTGEFPPEVELLLRGFDHRMVARMRTMREEQIASGLSPQEFADKLRERAEKSQERADEVERGWGLPIVTGFIGAAVLGSIWGKVSGDVGWAPLISIVFTGIGIASQFDRENLPPRRRMIAGILIGVAVAGLFIVPMFLLS